LASNRTAVQAHQRQRAVVGTAVLPDTANHPRIISRERRGRKWRSGSQKLENTGIEEARVSSILFYERKSFPKMPQGGQGAAPARLGWLDRDGAGQLLLLGGIHG